MISSAFAQAAQTASQTTENPDTWMGLVPFVVLMILMYFMFIRPQQKRAKEHKTMTESLQTGDEVMLAGGIVARIQKLEEQYATVEIAKDVAIQVQRNAVQAQLPKGTISGF